MVYSNFNEEKLLERFIQGMPVAIYTTDSEGYISTYNQAAVELWGREPKVGEELMVWLLENLQDRWVETFTREMSYGSHPQRKAGSVRPGNYRREA